MGECGVQSVLTIHHDDVLPLAIRLLAYPKFRNILRGQYPFIFVDEYQDADTAWINAIREHFIRDGAPPLFGFFGDHWQKIYGNGCGKLTDPSLVHINKEANFRSVSTIVDCLNRMRPELQQFVADPTTSGEIRVFHTNDWPGKRQTGLHHDGDLPDADAAAALQIAVERLSAGNWNFLPRQTKILMLTHRALGKQQGYGTLPSVFANNSSFTRKEHPHVAYFVDRLEPALRAFSSGRYGEMLATVGRGKAQLHSVADKKLWSESLQRLLELRDTSSIAAVINHLRRTGVPSMPDTIERLEAQLGVFDPSSDDELTRSLQELQRLHSVPYREIIALTDYLLGHSPFETKHGVKGAEFENVLVVVGRGWSKYNFGRMLEKVKIQQSLQDSERSAFEENRNLFYVACSRPKRRLAVLFTQLLSASALETVAYWFGATNVHSLFGEQLIPREFDR